MATRKKTKISKPLKRKKVVSRSKGKAAIKKAVVRKAPSGFVPTKLKLRRPVPSDIDIAQEAKLKPILQVAEELGIRPDELELYGPYKAKVKLDILDRLKKPQKWQIYRCDCHYPNTTGRRKNNNHCGPLTGSRCPSGQEGHHCNTSTIPRSYIWHQRWSSRGRLFASNPHGRFQPSFDRRYPCHHRSPQFVCGRHGCQNATRKPAGRYKII